MRIVDQSNNSEIARYDLSEDAPTLVRRHACRPGPCGLRPHPSVRRRRLRLLPQQLDPVVQRGTVQPSGHLIQTQRRRFMHPDGVQHALHSTLDEHHPMSGPGGRLPT
jgi:hypothetical protein